MKLIFTGLVFFFAILFNAQAQRACGTNDYRQRVLKSDPSLHAIFQDIEDQIAKVTKRTMGNIALRDTTANEVINIPVVIHVLYKTAAENISDAQIRSQLDVLNMDFNMLNSDQMNAPKVFKSVAGSARIQFCLAQVDPAGRKTSGIERKYTPNDLFTTDDGMKMALKGGTAAWDSKRYLNIWVCKLNSRSIGYATPPGAASELDGVVIAYDVFGTVGNLRPVFNKGRTATHEVGHWLGLIHTWGDDVCGDDQVEDTPEQQSYNFGCQSFPKMSACSRDNNGDMFMNFMDFSDDACMSIFTKGQVSRMRALFAQNGSRNSFLASFACDSSLAQGGSLPVVIPEVSQPTPGLSASKLYPTRVNAAVTIECPAATPQTVQSMNIFNTLGVKMFTTRLSQEKTILDLSRLVPGIYIVHITGGNDYFTAKFVKQ